jgi:hypothetical protein
VLLSGFGGDRAVPLAWGRGGNDTSDYLAGKGGDWLTAITRSHPHPLPHDLAGRSAPNRCGPQLGRSSRWTRTPVHGAGADRDWRQQLPLHTVQHWALRYPSISDGS